MALRLVVTDRYLLYVKHSMRLPLLASGVILLLLGATTILVGYRRRDRNNVHAGHRHGPMSVGWLVLAPVVLLLAVAPPSLGASAARAASQSASTAPPPASDQPLAPMAGSADGQPVAMTINDYIERDYADDHGGLDAGVPVVLTGFVTKVGGEEGFHLVRFRIFCCAADAQAFEVGVRGVSGDVPADDTWVEVTGTWTANQPVADQNPLSQITAQSVTVIPAPSQPYE